MKVKRRAGLMDVLTKRGRTRPRAAVAGVGGDSVPDATTSTKGKLRLTGDLGGTADSPTVPGLSGKQPLDSDLTAIAALSTTSFGRALLALADAAAARSTIGAAATSHTHAQSDVTNLVSDLAAKQPLDSDLTSIAALSTTSYGRSLLTVANAAGLGALVTLNQIAQPTADVPMNTRKLTGLLQGSTAGDSVEYAQMVAGDVASQLGFQLKSAVTAVSIQALPAHSRSGDVLTASSNGFLAPSFGTLKFSWSSGAAGSGNGQFSESYDVAVDSSGNFFVLDRGNSRVQKFNSSGVYQSQFGSVGTGNGQFTRAAGIAIDSTDRIYVIDKGRVQRFTSAGGSPTTIVTLPDVATSFDDVGGLAVHVDSSGNIYIAWTSDSGYPFSTVHRVAKYNSSGTVQWTIGGAASSANGSFNTPLGIATDSSGNVFVADGQNHRVQKFNSSGTYQSQFGTVGSTDGLFKAPAGIEIDSSGNIWVADYFNHRVQKFNSSGVYQAQYGGQGSGNGQLLGPRGIVVTSGGDLVVADSLNNRFQRYTAFSLATNDTVLVRHEGSGTHIENSIYTVTNPGGASAQWVLTLRSDMGQGYAKNQSLVIALTENGQQNRVFTLNTPDPITVWTTALTWSRFEPGGPPSPHAANHSPGGTDPIATGTPVSIGTANAEGTSTAVARADHVHDRNPPLGIHTLTSSFTTTGTHTTFQDEGLTKSITYLADRLLKVTLKVNPNPSGGAPQIVRYQLLRGATVIGMWQHRAEATGVTSKTFTAFVETPSSGSTETFKVQVCAAVGNTAVQSYGDGSFVRQLVVEDIGPA